MVKRTVSQKSRIRLRTEAEQESISEHLTVRRPTGTHADTCLSTGQASTQRERGFHLGSHSRGFSSLLSSPFSSSLFPSHSLLPFVPTCHTPPRPRSWRNSSSDWDTNSFAHQAGITLPPWSSQVKPKNTLPPRGCFCDSLVGRFREEDLEISNKSP